MGDTRFHFTTHQTPKSPDVNQTDYRIREEMEWRFCQKKVHDVDELKQRMLCPARGLEQSVISDAIDE